MKNIISTLAFTSLIGSAQVYASEIEQRELQDTRYAPVSELAFATSQQIEKALAPRISPGKKAWRAKREELVQNILP